jgi:hypothetical protein
MSRKRRACWGCQRRSARRWSCVDGSRLDKIFYWGISLLDVLYWRRLDMSYWLGEFTAECCRLRAFIIYDLWKKKHHEGMCMVIHKS